MGDEAMGSPKHQSTFVGLPSIVHLRPVQWTLLVRMLCSPGSSLPDIEVRLSVARFERRHSSPLFRCCFGELLSEEWPLVWWPLPGAFLVIERRLDVSLAQDTADSQ